MRPPIPGTGTPTSQRLDSLDLASPPLPGLPDRDMSASPSAPSLPALRVSSGPQKAGLRRNSPAPKSITLRQLRGPPLLCSPAPRLVPGMAQPRGPLVDSMPPRQVISPECKSPGPPKALTNHLHGAIIVKRTEPFRCEHFIAAELTLHHETEPLYSGVKRSAQTYHFGSSVSMTVSVANT